MLPSYTLCKQISEDGRTLICRGQRRKDGLPVIVKRLKPEEAATEAGALRLRAEYELLARLDLPGVIKVFGLDDDQGLPVLVMEDIGGEVLDHPPERTKLTLPQFLALGGGLAETLAGLHRQGIIHKDINPRHIIYNPATGQFRLIGFAIAEELPRRVVAPSPPGISEGTLAYISPEQTGRMNRSLDYRTDFYSLGVTFYWMLTGRLPFETDDPLEMVHCHLAKEPMAPHRLDPEIPETVSRIVMKLMAKIAEERYQSGYGLHADLERCRIGLAKHGLVPDFEPGEEDVPEQLHLTSKLYGREQETGRLLAAFERACAGGLEMVLVAGYSGTGKTALAHGIHRTIVEKRGNFIEGKFDQLQRTVPYSAWIHAFSGLVNTMLMEGETQLACWRRDILQAVGNLGRVLIEVIPNLLLVLGPQPDVPVLGATEAHNRFNHVFLEFVKTLATREHPLVIFLDDLQWIDDASLSLLQTLFGASGVSSLLVIGAYRDNEVDAQHPLSKGVDALRRDQASIELMTLQNVVEEEINALIADTLHDELGRTQSLTRLLYSKTEGNPFFLLQTFMGLVERRALTFDSEERHWQWDIEALAAMGITDNVVVLMLEKLQELPRETRQLLPMAACLGFRFKPAGLTLIAEQSEERTLEALRPALREGLLLPMGQDFRFAHDRIQQAAYTLLPEEERLAVHWRIGQRLLREIPPAEQNDRLFDIVNQLNAGVSCLATPEEARELAGLNRQAGRKAKAGAAFHAAVEYFEVGLDLLCEASWETNYELTLSLHLEAAEANCLCGRYERMATLIALTRHRARSILEAVPVCGTEIRALTAQGRLVPAIQSGLRSLERLGLRLPEEPSAAEVNEAMSRTHDLLQQHGIAGLSDLPRLTSPLQSASLYLLSEIGEPAYAASPHFFLVWASAMAELSLRYGNCALSPFAYAAYALALCATGEIETGSLLSKAAIAMIDALDARSLRCRLLNIHGCTIQPWTEHLRETLPTLNEAIEAGTESGDFTSASYAAFNSCTAAFFMGEPLGALEIRISANQQIIAGLRQTYIWNWVAFHVPVIRRLHGGKNGTAEPCDFDEASWLSAAREANDRCGLAYYFLGRLIAAYLLSDGEPSEALGLIDQVQANMAGFQGAFAVPVFAFFSSLTLLKQHGTTKTGNTDAIQAEVRPHLVKLEALAQYAPMNFQHKRDLVAAELARVNGEEWRAAGLYEKAITQARDNGFLQEEALACELTARFYLAHGREENGRLFMDQAQRGYAHWQAFAKVDALQAEFPHWLKWPDRKGAMPETSLLDLESILKVTQTISGTIEMDQLLGKVMRIVIENAGAQIGFLLMQKNGVWTIATKGEIGASDVEISAPVAIDDSAAVATGVIHYVARTRATVVLDDAAIRGDFAEDPHIRRAQTRSLLCTPLSYRGRLLGILYLENNLTSHAFTCERVQLLEILLSQAAISLDTAGAYEALRLNELRYRLGQTAAHIGTWEYDLQHDRFWGSDEAKHIYGFDPDAVDFSTDDVESHIPERQQVHQALLDLIDRGVPYNLEYEIRPENSSTPKFISSIAELHRDLQGKPVKVVGVIQDISERKRAEEELRRLNDELEQRVKDRTTELEDNNRDLERMNKLFVGRELRMIELKERIKELEGRLGERLTWPGHSA